MVVDAVASHSVLQPVDVACRSILASTVWNGHQAVYFIVLIDTGQDQTRGQIFVVQANTAREDSDLEGKLTAEIGGREILKVKSALRKLVESP